MTGTVKPLEWLPEPPYTVARISALRMHYAIERIEDDYANPSWWLGGSSVSAKLFDSMDEAKAAAQADYERRILSALTASASEPAKPEVWRFTQQTIDGDEWPWTYTEKRSRAEQQPIWEGLAVTVVTSSEKAAPKPIAHIDHGKTSLTAALARGATPVPASEPEPVAWSFELAGARNRETGEWAMWSKPKLSFEKPCVPEGSVRNLRALTYANPVPTPDGAVEAAKPIIDVVKALEGQYGFTDDLPVDARHFGRPFNDFPSLRLGDLRRFVAALETPWQKPGRAAQAQAGEKPDFPADEQSGETSHGASVEALTGGIASLFRAFLQGANGSKSTEPFNIAECCRVFTGAVRSALSAALSHPADGWRDIRTAPRDGTHFLAYETTGEMYRACYVEGGDAISCICGQPMVQPAEPEFWLPLDALPERPAAPAAKPEGE